MNKNSLYLVLLLFIPSIWINKASAQMGSTSITTGKMTKTIMNSNIAIPKYDAKNIESINRLSITSPGTYLPYHEISLPGPALLNQEDKLYDEPIHPYEPKISNQGSKLDQSP